MQCRIHCVRRDVPLARVRNAVPPHSIGKGAELILMSVVPDAIPGFEHHSFTCLECHITERRVVFTRHGREDDGGPMPLHTAPPIVPASSAHHEHIAALGLFGRAMQEYSAIRVFLNTRVLTAPEGTARLCYSCNVTRFFNFGHSARRIFCCLVTKRQQQESS